MNAEDTVYKINAHLGELECQRIGCEHAHKIMLDDISIRRCEPFGISFLIFFRCINVFGVMVHLFADV